MTTPTTSICRVRIVNHITGRTVVVESPRDPAMVWLDLVRLVRYINRRRDETLRASVHLLQDLIVLNWHTPNYWADDIVRATLEITQPLYDAEKLICEGVQT
jgi:hypothetical protein